jgi:hypothetical protein
LEHVLDRRPEKTTTRKPKSTEKRERNPFTSSSRRNTANAKSIVKQANANFCHLQLWKSNNAIEACTLVVAIVQPQDHLYSAKDCYLARNSHPRGTPIAWRVTVKRGADCKTLRKQVLILIRVLD